MPCRWAPRPSEQRATVWAPRLASRGSAYAKAARRCCPLYSLRRSPFCSVAMRLVPLVYEPVSHTSRVCYNGTHQDSPSGQNLSQAHTIGTVLADTLALPPHTPVYRVWATSRNALAHQ
jgi:hypothetical protein